MRKYRLIADWHLLSTNNGIIKNFFSLFKPQKPISLIVKFSSNHQISSFLFLIQIRLTPPFHSLNQGSLTILNWAWSRQVISIIIKNFNNRRISSTPRRNWRIIMNSLLQMILHFLLLWKDILWFLVVEMLLTILCCTLLGTHLACNYSIYIKIPIWPWIFIFKICVKI